MKSFKNWSISTKILLIILISLTPICGIITLKVIPDFEEKLISERSLALQQVVESAYGILQVYDRKVSSGQISLNQAQELAIDEINALRYSGKEYFFMYDMKGTVKALGSNPEKKGQNRYDIKDGNGVKFVKEMIDVSLFKGEGFVKYYYPKLGEKKASPKLSYVKYFQPWDFFVGSGIYIDNLENSIQSFKTRIYIFMISAFAAALVIGLLVAGRITKPIKTLDDSAKKFSKGDMNIRINIDSKDELGNLGNSFNQMLQKITESIQAVREKQEMAEISAKNSIRSKT